VQKLFKFDDGEYVVGAISFDDRVLPKPVPPEPTDQGQLFDLEGEAENAPDDPYVVAISKGGQATRFTLDGFKEPSTRTGRMYMRFDGDDEAVGARLARGHENVCLASHDGRALVFPAHQVSVYKGAAKGVRAIKLESEDRVLGFTLSDKAREGFSVATNNGREETVRTTKFDVTNRGAKGTLVIKRGYFAEAFPEPVIQSADDDG
jgi:DNA gyrase subunit A